MAKSYSVFIQTDKSVYNPGDKVLFRVIALNSQLKPAAGVRNEALNIHASVRNDLLILIQTIAN